MGWRPTAEQIDSEAHLQIHSAPGTVVGGGIRMSSFGYKRRFQPCPRYDRLSFSNRHSIAKFRFRPNFVRSTLGNEPSWCRRRKTEFDPERTFKTRELVGRLSLIVLLHLCGCASPERPRYSATAQRIHDYIAWSSG